MLIQAPFEGIQVISLEKYWGSTIGWPARDDGWLCLVHSDQRWGVKAKAALAANWRAVQQPDGLLS